MVGGIGLVGGAFGLADESDGRRVPGWRWLGGVGYCC